MTIPTREEAIRIFDDIVTDYQMPVGSQRINRLRSYIESHIGEVACPRSANGRPENFTVRECVAAGECGCGESVTPGSTVRASPVQPMAHEWHERFGLTCCKVCGFVRNENSDTKGCRGPVYVSLRDASPVQPVLEWDGDNLLLNGKEIGRVSIDGAASGCETWSAYLLDESLGNCDDNDFACDAVISAARQWLSGGDK